MKKNKLKKRSQDFITTCKMTKFALSLIYKDKSGKKYIWIKCIVTPVFSLLPLLHVIVPGLIITELSEHQRINFLILYVSIIAIVPILNSTLSLVSDKYLQNLRMKIETRLHADLYSHMYSLDYEMNEDPEIQLMQERAVCTNEEIMYIIDGVMNFASSILKFAALFTIISKLNLFFVALVMIFVVINSIVLKKVNQEKYDLQLEINKYNRGVYGTTTVLDSFEHSAQVRLYNLQHFFISKFIGEKTKKDKIELKHYCCSHKLTISTSITNFIQQILVYVYVIYKVIKNKLSIGDMTIYMSAINQFANSLSNISKTYLNLASRNMKMQDFINLYNLQQTIHNTGNKIPDMNRDSVIEFKNVSFKYPGSNFYALHNVNLKIYANEKLCIVGENGSGKSTFIKLLTRLYYPEKGEILLDGVNINEFDYTEYVKLFASAMQDYKLYHISIKENIVLDQKLDKDNLENSYKQSGMTQLLEKVCYGEDTQVYKWETINGFQPSGGEEQRIAIARAIYRNSRILLLDEPTAALDPKAECEIYTHLHSVINNKCAVLITHRLSAVQLADKVVVFNKGCIAEYGTHNELYEKGGIYTEMFDKQAKFYRDKNTSEN